MKKKPQRELDRSEAPFWGFLGQDDPNRACPALRATRFRLASHAVCALLDHIYLSPIRPNSVLKISSHPVPYGRHLGFENV
jgi:hypothetical protein